MRPARPTAAPPPPATATTPPSKTARTASGPPCRRPARSSGRPATSWPSSATTRSPPPDSPNLSWRPRRGHAGPGQERLQPHSPDGEPPRPAPVSRLSAAAGLCARNNGQADGPIRLSGRIPAGGDTRSNILSPGQHPRAPCTQVRLAAFLPAPGRHGWSPRTERPATRTANPPFPGNPAPPCPRGRHDRLPGGLVKDAYGAGSAGRAYARSWTRLPARRTRQLSGGREQTPAHPKQDNHGPEATQTNACGHRPIQVRRLGAQLF